MLLKRRSYFSIPFRQEFIISHEEKVREKGIQTLTSAAHSRSPIFQGNSWFLQSLYISSSNSSYSAFSSGKLELGTENLLCFCTNVYCLCFGAVISGLLGISSNCHALSRFLFTVSLFAKISGNTDVSYRSSSFEIKTKDRRSRFDLFNGDFFRFRSKLECGGHLVRGSLRPGCR